MKKDMKKLRTTSLEPETFLRVLPRASKVLNGLTHKDQTLTYQQFLVAIGLLDQSTPWEARYRNWASAVLYTLSAVERMTKGKTSLQYERIVDRGGKPGMGFGREAYLMRTTTQA